MKKTPLLLSLSAAALLIVGCANNAQTAAPKGNPNKVEIFNGKDLTGFKKLGGDATYAVNAEGALVGTSTRAPSAFTA